MADSEPSAPAPAPASTTASARSMPGWLLPALVVLLLVLVCLKVGTLMSDSGSGADPIADQVRESRYQAGFLDNDRVYFGHLRDRGEGWYELRDTHFIQQEPAAGEKEATLKVAPVSDELQEPDGTMYIHDDHIVLVQDLAADSKV